MRRRRRHVKHANHERWLVSYADFITLLFAFFVVLYASSQVDKKKVGKLAQAIQAAFQDMGVFQADTNVVQPDVAEPMPFSAPQAMDNTERAAPGALDTSGEKGDWVQLQNQMESALASEINRKEVVMRSEPEGLVISLREAGFFESGSAKMKAASLPAFDRIANIVRDGEYPMRIEGHTDNTPIHNSQFPSNWELSTSRATEIVRLLIVRDGFGPDRLSAAGYAEYHPVSNNSSAEGRGANRRVDIIILSKPAIAAAAQAGNGIPGENARALDTVAPNGTLKPTPAIVKPISVQPTSITPAVGRFVDGRRPH